jgi:D-amino-acid oxidase
MLVVGAGVIGLSSAARLLQAGHDVEVWAARLPPHTTSNVAAAFWFPYAAAPRARVLDWAARSLREFRALASDPATGVHMHEAIDLDRSPREGDPWWADAVDDVRRARPAELPPGFVDGHVFVAPVIDMRVYLPWLLDRVVAAGGRVVTRRLGALAEATASHDRVVCCTGLGARELVGDPTLFPIRGQLVHVADPGLSRVVLDEAGPDGVAYVVPRGDDVVLGGTAQADDDDERARPEDAADVLARCERLVPGIAAAPRLADVVGLRPGRATVRLETEHHGSAVVVHNYGHGGAGVTLSWGCADEVVARLAHLGPADRPAAGG